MAQNKRYQVYSIKAVQDRNGGRNEVWVKAGSAWVNRDGSMNVYLDVLPLEGRLHVREAQEKRDAEGTNTSNSSASANGSPAMEAMTADSMGGH